MAGKKSLESRKSKLKEVNENIKEKGDKIKELEDSYDKAYDKRMEVENDSNIDEEVKDAYREKSAETLRSFIEKGKEAADDLDKELNKLKEIKLENDEAITANEQGRKRAAALDSAASERNIESNTAEKFESHDKVLNEFGGEINNAKNQVEALQRSAKNLKRFRDS